MGWPFNLLLRMFVFNPIDLILPHYIYFIKHPDVMPYELFLVSVRKCHAELTVLWHMMAECWKQAICSYHIGMFLNARVVRVIRLPNTQSREYRVVRIRYSRLLSTSEDRLAPICACKNNRRIWNHSASALRSRDVSDQLWWRHNAKSENTVHSDNSESSDR